MNRNIVLFFILIFLVVPAVFAAGYWGYQRFSSTTPLLSLNLGSQQFSLEEAMNEAQQETKNLELFNEDAEPFTPQSSLRPILKSCLFPYFKACVTQVGTRYINEGNHYDELAVEDISFILDFHHQSAIKTHMTPATAAQLREYFPEYSAQAEKLERANEDQVLLPAPEVLQRIAQKENINPRILLVLMEVIRGSKGPLLLSQDPQYPYLQMDLQKSETQSFFSQVELVAKRLRSAYVKYYLLFEQQTLPLTFSAYQKEYQVESDVNPETLAIAEVLSEYILGKKEFEKAITLPETGTSGVVPLRSFVVLYQKLFGASALE